MKKTQFHLVTIFIAILITAYGCGTNHTPATSGNSTNAGQNHGQAVYSQTCATCHQADGKGMPGTFPPLAQSDFLARGKDAAIAQVIKGKAGELTVNGVTYNNVMPPQTLNDEDIAAVLTYVYASFGNNGIVVSAGDVSRVRASLK